MNAPGAIRNPFVSICVPTYNRVEFLKRSLSSILAQRYEPLEILIGDNASTDTTAEVCQQAARTDRRVRHIRREKNIVIYSNHNRLIEEARGEYLCFLHDDDEYDPCLIQEEVSFLRRHPEAGIVSPDWTLIDENGNTAGSRNYGVPLLQEGPRYIEQTLRTGRSSVGLSGTMIRKTALGSARFDEAGPTGFGDFVLWFEIAERWKVGHILKPLYAYRLHTRALSQRSILSITEDYRMAMESYCAGHLIRWPRHHRIIERWHRLINRYLFWMLAYEICLYYNRQGKPKLPDTFQFRTIFERMDYRLSSTEFQELLAQFGKIRSGWIETATRQMMEQILSQRWTWLLGNIAPYAPAFRRLLGFQPTMKRATFLPSFFREEQKPAAPKTGEWIERQDIVCISSIDWDFIWQGHQEIMSTLAQAGHRVLFIENTGIRSASWADMPRLKRRLSHWWHSICGFRQEKPNLYVYSPLGLPFPYSRMAQIINLFLIRWDLNRWMRAMEFDRPIVWTFLPTPLAMELTKSLHPKLVIYYCIDNFAASSRAARKIRKAEERMFRTADVVFVTSEELFQYASGYNTNVYRFPFGVNFELFERVKNASAPMPEEMARIPSPRIGYIGGIHRWMDINLLSSAARQHPDLQFVLVGPIQTDISSLRNLANMHLLGPKPHDCLPGYIRAFDVCLIPYRITEYTDHVYPTKLNEYLAMGKPVVSTPMKEVALFNERHGAMVALGATPEELGRQIRVSLSNGDDQQADQRIAVAKENSWQNKTQKMEQLIQQKLLEKSGIQDLRWQERYLDLYRTTRRKLVGTLTAGAAVWILLFYSPLPWYAAAPLFQADRPREADAIVVFAGGVGESGKAGQGYEERVKRAVELYQAGFSKHIIFSSGYVHLFHETAVMKALAVSLGIPGDHILLETASQNTHENVLNVSRLLNQNGWHSILLISSPYHMRRALSVFVHLAPSIQVTRTPVVEGPFYSRRQIGMTPEQLHGIVHEYLSLLYYRLKGWI